MLKIVSIICLIFSLLLLLSCQTTKLDIGGEKWPLPERPKMLPVVIHPIDEIENTDNGFYLYPQDIENLSINIEELKAYIKKLEALISKMNTYYKENK